MPPKSKVSRSKQKQARRREAERAKTAAEQADKFAQQQQRAIKAVNDRRSYLSPWRILPETEPAISEFALPHLSAVKETLEKYTQDLSSSIKTKKRAAQIKIITAVQLAYSQLAELEELGDNRNVHQELHYITLNDALDEYKAAENHHKSWSHSSTTNQDFLTRLQDELAAQYTQDLATYKTAPLGLSFSDIATDPIAIAETCFADWQAEKKAAPKSHVTIEEVDDDGNTIGEIPRIDEEPTSRLQRLAGTVYGAAHFPVALTRLTARSAQSVITMNSAPLSQEWQQTTIGSDALSFLKVGGTAAAVFYAGPIAASLLPGAAAAEVTAAAATPVMSTTLTVYGASTGTATAVSANVTSLALQGTSLADAAYMAALKARPVINVPDEVLHAQAARVIAHAKPVDTSHAVTINTAQPAPAPTYDIPAPGTLIDRSVNVTAQQPPAAFDGSVVTEAQAEAMRAADSDAGEAITGDQAEAILRANGLPGRAIDAPPSHVGTSAPEAGTPAIAPPPEGTEAAANSAPGNSMQGQHLSSRLPFSNPSRNSTSHSNPASKAVSRGAPAETSPAQSSFLDWIKTLPRNTPKRAGARRQQARAAREAEVARQAEEAQAQAQAARQAEEAQAQAARQAEEAQAQAAEPQA
ncbi:MAG: hypothetical protein P1U63_08865, partial [Coxiellaceae bacterium]|nr:hypothetical protein [Coxiellaceae bacterium]